MIISILVAADERGGIGLDGRLPWHLSDDLRNFKRLTMGHRVLMGRRTYETVTGKLPGRSLLVLSRNPEFAAGDADIFADFEQAVDYAREHGEEELFVIGGAQVFAAALPHAERMYLTRVHAEVEADTFFPEFDREQWELVEEAGFQAGPKNDYAFTIQRWERIKAR